MKTILAPNTNELQKISELSAEGALQQAAPFLNRLVEDPAFMEDGILPLLEEAQGAKNWYVARRYDGEDGVRSLQVCVWPPGTGTEVHDHASWGAFACVAGWVLEERYERLDNGSRPDHARLRRAWQLAWGPEHGVSTLLPGDGGIHRVANKGDAVAVSVHIYGPKTGGVDGRDYDPYRDHVCDRLEG